MDLVDLTAFRLSLGLVPTPVRSETYEVLRVALSGDRQGEPTQHQLRSRTDLSERLQSPVALLLRQIRLEKLSILAEAITGNGPAI